MELAETHPDATKTNLNELRTLKVKIPVRLLVNLQCLRLTQSRSVSTIIAEALAQYVARIGPEVPESLAPRGVTFAPHEARHEEGEASVPAHGR